MREWFHAAHTFNMQNRQQQRRYYRMGKASAEASLNKVKAMACLLEPSITDNVLRVWFTAFGSL